MNKQMMRIFAIKIVAIIYYALCADPLLNIFLHLFLTTDL